MVKSRGSKVPKKCGPSAKKREKSSLRIKPTARKEKEEQTVTNSVDDDGWWSNAERYIRDGRVFEADREMVFSEDEEAEIAEFERTLKYYNATSRKLRRIAIMQEQDELRNGKISGYFEGTVQDRLGALRTGQRLLEQCEIVASHRDRN